MSWSTELFCRIGFSHETYNNIDEVQDKLEQLNKEIETCEQSIRDLVIMTEPAKFYNKEDYDSPYSFVYQEYRDNMELLEELLIDRYKITLLLDNWDQCHRNDVAIDPPENVHYDSAFLWGDFVKSEKYPNGTD